MGIVTNRCIHSSFLLRITVSHCPVFHVANNVCLSLLKLRTCTHLKPGCILSFIRGFVESFYPHIQSIILIMIIVNNKVCLTLLVEYLSNL